MSLTIRVGVAFLSLAVVSGGLAEARGGSSRLGRDRSSPQTAPSTGTRSAGRSFSRQAAAQRQTPPARRAPRARSTPPARSQPSRSQALGRRSSPAPRPAFQPSRVGSSSSRRAPAAQPSPQRSVTRSSPARQARNRAAFNRLRQRATGSQPSTPRSRITVNRSTRLQNRTTGVRTRTTPSLRGDTRGVRQRTGLSPTRGTSSSRVGRVRSPFGSSAGRRAGTGSAHVGRRTTTRDIQRAPATFGGRGRVGTVGRRGPAAGTVRGARTGTVSRRGGAHAVVGTRRGTVRYSSGGVPYYTGPYYDQPWYGPHRPFIYRSFYRRWRDHRFYAYRARWFGPGPGYFAAYWDPFYYDAYSSFWVRGSPPFGFGTVYYEPTFNTYFAEEPVRVEVPVYVEVPVAAGAEAPAEEILPEDAPGRAEFELGIEAFLAGRYPEALDLFRAAAQADPENGEAWMAVAHSAFAVGFYPEAAAAIAEAADLGAFPRGYRYDPAPMYPEEGRFETLLARLEKWRALHPEDADAHLVAAYLYVALGRTPEASDAIVQVLSLRPENTTAPILNVALLPPLPPEQAELPR